MIGQSVRTKERGKPLHKHDELAFKVWAETGSLANARLYFQKNKILHDDGKQYSIAGIRYCAIRHMISNYDDSLSHLMSEYEKRGIIPNQEAIEITLLGYAIEILKYKNSVVEWAKDHGLYDKYSNFIEEKTKDVPLESKRATANKPI